MFATVGVAGRANVDLSCFSVCAAEGAGAVEAVEKRVTEETWATHPLPHVDTKERLYVFFSEHDFDQVR